MEAARGLSRRRVLRLATLLVGGVGVAGLLRPGRAQAQVVGDTDILADLVVLEDTAAFVYAKTAPALAAPSGKGAAASGSSASSSSSSSSAASASTSTSSTGTGTGAGNGAGPGAGGAAGAGQNQGGGSTSTSGGAGGSSSAARVGPLDAVGFFGAQHAAARDVLLQALQRLGGKLPTVDAQYPDALPKGDDAKAALASLGGLEGTIMGAQYAALGRLGKRELRGLVASAYGVGARRQAVLAVAAGNPATATSAFVTGDAAGAAKLVPFQAPG